MFAPTRLVRGLAALALCALCSCSNDDTGASSGSTGVALNDAGRPIPGGSFTLTGALSAAGGNCSGDGAVFGAGLGDDARVLITCTDAPEPVLDLTLNVPSPPEVGTYSLNQMVPGLSVFQYDDPTVSSDLGMSTGAESLTLKLSVVSLLPDGAGFAVHGTATGTFSLAESTTVDVNFVF